MEDAVTIADVDETLPHADRRLERGRLVLPFFLAGVQVQGIKMLIVGANINRIADERGRAFHAVFRLEGPANFQFLGQTIGRDAGLMGVATEERPLSADHGQIVRATVRRQQSQSETEHQKGVPEHASGLLEAKVLRYTTGVAPPGRPAGD